jgi:hypothetical protein
MKKALLVLAVLLAAFLAYWLWLKFSPSKFIDGFYIVPDDAVWVVETKDPVKEWQNFSTSEMWQDLKEYEPFAEITSNADMLDEMISSNRQLFSLLGKRHLLISAHMTKAKDYDFVYYTDLESISKSDIVKASITSVIKQMGYRHTVRNYQNIEINEYLDPKTRDVLSFAFINNYLVISYNKLLMDKVIESSINPVKQLGKNPAFVEVDQLTSNNGMCRFFINYSTFYQYAGVFMDDVKDVKDWLQSLHYTGFDFQLNENVLSADGYTMVNDSLASYIQALSVSGKSNTRSEKIFSNKASFYVSLGFNQFTDFYDNLVKILEKDEKAYKEQQVAIKRFEKLLGINMQKHFYSWIGSEVAIAQYETNKLIGNKVRNVMLIHANSISSAKENLELIEKKIRKRTPIKFTDAEYKGYTIKYLEMKGLFKHLFGDLFAKINKPYYCIIDDFVVLSDDPKTLLVTIDDYLAQNTMVNHEPYRQFRSRFTEKTSVMAYMSPNHHFQNFKGLLNKESWTSSQKQQRFIRCFEHVGMSLSGDGDRMRTVFAARYQKWEAPVEVVDTSDAETDTLSAMDLFIIEHFNQNMNTEFYDNGNPKVVYEMEGKQKDGMYMEYYENRVIKVKGRYKDGKRDGTWKYYHTDGKYDYKEKYIEGELKKRNLFEKLWDKVM